VDLQPIARGGGLSDSGEGVRSIWQLAALELAHKAGRLLFVFGAR